MSLEFGQNSRDVSGKTQNPPDKPANGQWNKKVDLFQNQIVFPRKNILQDSVFF